MKHFLKKIFLLLPLIIHSPCYGDVSGYIEAIEITVPGREDNIQVPYFAASASYVSGGVTFTYPMGLFSSAPTVKIGIELSGIGFLASRVISAQITANSSTSTTVRVNLGTIITILEAGTGDVIVHLFAVET